MAFLIWAPLLTSWAQVSVKITSSVGSDFDYFGESVSIDGDLAIIGSWLEDSQGGKDAGAARIFRRVGAIWEEQTLLTASDGEAGDQFGYSVAINGDFAFVGAPRDDNENGPFAGAVYVFERNGTSWIEAGKIVAVEGALDDQFGYAIASRGNRLLIGAPGVSLTKGAAYVYHETGGDWLFVNAIEASNGTSGDSFGSSVDIDDEYAVIGASNHDEEGLVDAGAAYAFVFNGAEWVEQAPLISADPAAGGAFGHAVSLSANYAIIGAPTEDILGQEEVGAAYVFQRNGAAWNLLTKLTAFDGAAGDEFGYSVIARGDYAAIGARWHRNNSGEQAGAAYLYRRMENSWTSEARLMAADAAVGDQFGSAVGFSNEQVIVGARWDDNERGRDAGAAYIFPVGGAGVPSLLANASEVDFGAESIGEDQEFSLSVANNGTADLNVTSIRIEGDDASHFRLIQGAGSALLAPLASIEVVLEFRPLSPGIKRAHLVVESNSPSSPERIELIGEGTEGLQPGVARILASRGGVATSFGSTVAVHGDYAIVGAEGQQDNEPGAAYIFRRVNAEWVQQTTLTALDGSPGDRFGSAVSISNTHAIVGAWNSDDATGAAYIFIRSGTAWIQQAKIVASDGFPDDQFGRSVTIDGDFAVVGAWQNDNERGAAAGAAYIYRLTSGVWNQYVKLLAADGQQGDRFGSAVEVKGGRVVVGAANGGFFGEGRAYIYAWQDPIWAPGGVLSPENAGLSAGFGSTVAIENDIAVIGAPNYDNAGSVDEGAVYIYQQELNGEWLLRSKLEATDGASGFEFGAAVAVQGNEVVIGAPGADNQRGAVYTYSRSGLVWLPADKIFPQQGQDGEAFGQALGYTGTDLIIGSPENSNINGTNAGLVYLYNRSISSWSFDSTLLATNRLIQPLFGSSVAIRGDLAVIGAKGKETDSGAAYVYERQSGGWSQVAELVASDGEAGDLFGASVGIAENYVVVGAPGDDNDGGADVGAVYIFLRGSDGWSEQARLLPSAGATQDSFGVAVAIDGELIAVGSPNDDHNQGTDAGSVYLYTPNGSTWQEQAFLVVPDGGTGDRFGYSLALENTTLVIGAPGAYNDDVNGWSGLTYVFENTGNNWAEEARLAASDIFDGEEFGVDVDLSDNYILVGADRQNNSQGAAYVFRRTSGLWGENEEAKIEIIGGGSNDRFGHTVALSENFALIGAPFSDNQIGATYLFERDGANWLQQSRLAPDDGVSGDRFGQVVDLDGGDALVGSSSDSNGNGDQAGTAYILSVLGSVSIVHNKEETPLLFDIELGQNYPNPAALTTTIPFFVPDTSPVRVELFDLLGRRVALLVDEMKTMGKYEVELDTHNLSSGTYLYRIETPSGSQVKSMVVVR